MPKAKERDGVFQRKDRPGWFVSYIHSAGKRKKEKVTAATRTQALASLGAIKVREERDKVLGVKLASAITTAELLAKFKLYQKSRVSLATFIRMQGILDNLTAGLPTLANDISRKDVTDYITRRSETAAAATIQKEISVLKHALRLAVEDWELLNTNAAQGAKLPKLPEGRTRYLSPPELKMALDAANDRMRGPIALAAFTGMRLGEILGLRWSAVDLAGRRVYLRNTKNGSLRVVSMNDLAIAVLESQPAAVFVFAAVDHEKLSIYTRRLFKRLGIEGASFHSLRHTAASGSACPALTCTPLGRF